MTTRNLICPVSNRKIDQNLSRLTIFLNVILMGIYLATLNPVFIVVSAVDYFIRAFMNPGYSPVRAVADVILKGLRSKEKPIDLAPKVFASRLGFLCAFTAAILYFVDRDLSSIGVTGFLLILSTADSVFNFCVGCHIYHYLVLPFYQRR